MYLFLHVAHAQSHVHMASSSQLCHDDVYRLRGMQHPRLQGQALGGVLHTLEASDTRVRDAAAKCLADMSRLYYPADWANRDPADVIALLYVPGNQVLRRFQCANFIY
jgi:hypothetical protein